MSHIQCPMCGLNSPLSKFNPSALDFDVRLVQFRGLGRGRGFEVSNEFSVLGDEEYSPMVAERVLALCGMFLENGVISREMLINKLRLKDEMIKPGEFVPREEFEKIWIQMNSCSKALASEKGKNNSLLQRLRSSKLDFEQKETEWRNNRKVELELLKIFKDCDAEIVIDDKLNWMINIKDLDERDRNTLINISINLDPDMRKQIFKRLKTKKYSHPENPRNNLPENAKGKNRL